MLPGQVRTQTLVGGGAAPDGRSMSATTMPRQSPADALVSVKVFGPGVRKEVTSNVLMSHNVPPLVKPALGRLSPLKMLPTGTSVRDRKSTRLNSSHEWI